MRITRTLLAAALTLAAAVALPAAAVAATSPWQLKNPVGPQQAMREELRAVCAHDGGTAWVAGAQNAVYFSHDGGTSWERQATGAPSYTVWRAVRFSDREHGFLAGAAAGRGLVYATSDGGATWSPRAATAPPLSDIDLDGSHRVWAVGAGGVVLASSDGGATWRRSSAGAEIAALDFAGSARGVAVGPRGVILRTTDGGATWRRALALTTADLADVVMQSPTLGWAVGAQGLVLRTVDGGLTWWRQATPSGLGDCLAVAFSSARRGWVTLSSGQVLGTMDGGFTWRFEIRSPNGPTLRALDAPPVDGSGSVWGSAGASAAATPHRGFAAGDGGTVVKYTEQGTQSPGNDVLLVSQAPGGSASPLPSGLSFELDGSEIWEMPDTHYDGWTANSFPNGSADCAAPFYQITIYADRHGDDLIAQAFTQFCGGAEITNTGATTPGDLNFGFAGTLSVTGVDYTIAFGQGHFTEGNNWWIGGPGFLKKGADPSGFNCIATPDSAWLFTASGSNSAFSMTPF